MDFEFANDGFLPYESFDYIYKDRKLPEFGDVKSPYVRELSTWKFFLANGEGEVPFGFESASFDDSDWDFPITFSITTPRNWRRSPREVKSPLATSSWCILPMQIPTSSVSTELQ